MLLIYLGKVHSRLSIKHDLTLFRSYKLNIQNRTVALNAYSSADVSYILGVIVCFGHERLKKGKPGGHGRFCSSYKKVDYDQNFFNSCSVVIYKLEIRINPRLWKL